MGNLHIHLSKIFAPVIGLLMTIQAFAQETNDSTTQIWSSAKRMQSITETASTVEIITAEEIKNSGHTNLGDVFRMVAGMDVRESDAMQHVLGIRGFPDSGHLLILIDGSSAYFRSTNYSYVDWLPVDIEEVERIEIVKGPMSVLYDGNSFSGIVNIITKKPDDLEQIQVNAVYGNFNTLRTNIIAAGKAKIFDYSVTAGARTGDVWEVHENPNLAAKRYSTKHFALKGNYQFTNEKNLKLNVRYSDADKVISKLSRAKTALIAATYCSADKSTLRISHNIQKRNMYGYSLEYYGQEPFLIVDKSIEVEYLRFYKMRNHRLTVGLDSRFDDNVLSWGDDDNWLNANTGDYYWSHNSAIFFDDQWKISKKISLNAGARLNYHREQKLLSNFRFVLLYKPGKISNLRFMVSNGHYIPSMFLQYNTGKYSFFVSGNEDIEVEKTLSAEISYFTYGLRFMDFRFNTFWNKSKNFILQNFDDSYHPINQDQSVTTAGIETEFIVKLGEYLKLKANGFLFYSDAGYYLSHISNFHYKANVCITAKINRLSFYSSFHYVDTYYELYDASNPFYYGGDLWNNNYYFRSDEGYHTLHANIIYNINNHITLNLAAYNVLNNKHYESKTESRWLPSDQIGRRFTVGMSVKF